MARDLMNIMSLCTAAVLALGAAWAIIRGDVYWASLAVWAVALMILPYLHHRELERSSINLLMLLMIPPYLASYLLGIGGSGILPLDSLWYLALSSIAIFALCMVTIACINSCSRMDLNLKFGMQVAFMFYASMIVIQGPIYFYSDLWLGTSIISSNRELMNYIVLATVNGLLFTVLFFAGARARLLRRAGAVKEAGE
jgi:hypothetical protein